MTASVKGGLKYIDEINLKKISKEIKVKSRP